MFICLDCGHMFDKPKMYTETHGLPYPPYETWGGCPKCGGVYDFAKECDVCGRCFDGEYVRIVDGTIVCSNCYEIEEG